MVAEAKAVWGRAKQTKAAVTKAYASWLKADNAWVKGRDVKKAIVTKKTDNKGRTVKAKPGTDTGKVKALATANETAAPVESEPILVQVIREKHVESEPLPVQVIREKHVESEPILVQVIRKEHVVSKPIPVQVIREKHVVSKPTLAKVVKEKPGCRIVNIVDITNGIPEIRAGNVFNLNPDIPEVNEKKRNE